MKHGCCCVSFHLLCLIFRFFSPNLGCLSRGCILAAHVLIYVMLGCRMGPKVPRPLPRAVGLSSPHLWKERRMLWVFFFHGKNLHNVKNQIFLHNFAWCRVCSGVWMEAKAALGVPRPRAALVPCPQHPSGQPAPPGWLARGPRKQLLNVNAGFRYWDAFNEKQRFCKSSLLEDSVQWKTDFLIKAVF